MEITLEDTSKVVALMRSMELYSSASYVKDMSDRILALEAEAGRGRAEVRQLVDDLAEEVWGDIEPSGEYTQSDHHFIGETPEYEELHRELLKRANAFLRAATATPSQPETEAVTDATMLRHMHAEMREENGGWTQDEDFD